MIDLSDLEYPLPKELIAQRPLPERSQARLLVVEKQGASLEHRRIGDLPGLMKPALWVFNDTKVFPARLLGNKSSGGKVELLLVERLGSTEVGERWLAMGRSSKGFAPGMKIEFANTLRAEILARRQEGMLEVELCGGPIDKLIEEIGHTPLPPYIERESDAEDAERYQTVYAQERGAVAAPTAGLHFSEALMDALQAAGHRIAFLTLHVGPGTFRPIQTSDLDSHRMHRERYVISPQVVEDIRRARAEGREIIAVGTTVVRALESSYTEQKGVCPGAGETELFIRPPYRFKVVDALITNFHLPGSTLLALVMAFGGIVTLQQAYAEALRERYRFFSYGDAMLIRAEKPL